MTSFWFFIFEKWLNVPSTSNKHPEGQLRKSDPLVIGKDSRISIRNRIHTKMSWIRNTGTHTLSNYISIRGWPHSSITEIPWDGITCLLHRPAHTPSPSPHPRFCVCLATTSTCPFPPTVFHLIHRLYEGKRLRDEGLSICCNPIFLFPGFKLNWSHMSSKSRLPVFLNAANDQSKLSQWSSSS